MCSSRLYSRQTLSHYKILDTLGAAGTAEIYVARDTKLDRHVALKILSPEMATHAEQRERFEREHREVTALDHPNIVTVRSVEDAGGLHFITTELVKEDAHRFHGGISTAKGV